MFRIGQEEIDAVAKVATYARDVDSRAMFKVNESLMESIKLQEELCEKLGCNHAIFMTSGQAALTSAIIATAVAKSTVRAEIPYMLLITLLLLGMGYTGNVVSFGEGIILWVAFLAYLGYLFYMAKKNKEEVAEDAKQKPMWWLLIAAVVGLVLVVWGSDVTVDAATNIAKVIGMSERFIGLTIVALGTSLPELFTSVSAAMKGKSDIAIGNIVGSNIFNILFVVGTTALITPVAFEPNFLIDTIIAIAAGVLLLLCVCKKQKLVRRDGIIMLVCYGAYFVYLLQ